MHACVVHQWVDVMHTIYVHSDSLQHISAMIYVHTVAAGSRLVLTMLLHKLLVLLCFSFSMCCAASAEHALYSCLPVLLLV